MELVMKVKDVHTIKGRGTVVVVDELPGNVGVGDDLVCGKYGWRIRGIEWGGTSRPRVNAGLILNGHVADMPEEGDELKHKPRELLDEKLGAITLRQLLEALERQSAERQELATILKDLNRAIDSLERGVGGDNPNLMALFKQMREAFNAIPPKWFHR
jgi:hypothetical protein